MCENFVEDLAVKFDDIKDMSESAPINPSDERSIGLLLLLYY